MDATRPGQDTAAGSRWAVLVAAALFALVAVAAVAVLARERQVVLRQAAEEVTTLSAVLEQNTARHFGGVDVALKGLAIHLAGRELPQDDEATRALMRAYLEHLPTVRALFVIGPDGWVRHDTDFPRTPRVSLADRDYFRRFVQEPQLQAAISAPLQSRSGTGWFVASARRIDGPGGGFGGIVVAAVQLDSFEQLYQSLALRPGQRMSLWERSGRLIARHPPDALDIGQSYPQAPLFRELALRPHGTYGAADAAGGGERLVAYRALERQPYVVAVSASTADALAGWRRATVATALGLALLAGVAWIGVRLFLQQEARQAEAVAARVAAAQARALAEANAKFRIFFEQWSSLAFVLSLDGTVLDANGVGDACIATADARTQPFWDLPCWGSAEARDALRAGFAQALAGEPFRGETAYRVAGSEPMQVDLLLYPMRDPDGAPFGVAALGVDITRRKADEAALRQLAEELRQADRHKNEFLATLSHELRNVLAPLHNSFQVLARSTDPGQVQRMRQVMERQLGQLKHLVDDLLDLSRVSSGKVELSLHETDLQELLASAAAAAQPAMAKAGHAFHAAFDVAGVRLQVDAPRMLQVFANLLGNAAKYTPAGGEVRFTARLEGGQALVEVSDTGIGIPPEAQAQVFRMFEQVRQHRAHAQGGLGIGLALVQNIVALHGGRVEVESAGSGQGSTFRVWLPVQRP